MPTRQWRWLGWRWLALLTLVRVTSCNANGLFSPQDVPGPPEKLLVSVASDSAVRVQFLPPEHAKAEGHNGAPVLGYKVEVAKRVNDVQTFKVEANGPVLAGAYKMAYENAAGVETTACVPWNATEVEFEMALEELPNVDSVSVSRSAFGTAAANGFVYAVEFDGRYLVSGEQPNVLVGDSTGCPTTLPRNRVLTFTGAHVTRGVPGYEPEVWEVASASSVDTTVLGGSFSLSLGFEGLWTDSGVTVTIAPGSKTATTTPSMVGLVNRGDAVKIGGEVFTVHATAPFTDTDLPLDSYHIRGATNAAVFLEDTALGDVAVTQNSQVVTTATSFKPFVAVGEHIKIGGVEFNVWFIDDTSLKIEKIGLGFADKWLGASRAHVTAYKRKKVMVDANAEAVDVKKALDGLPGIGKVDVARFGPTKAHGYRWVITFLSLGSKTSCPSSPCLHADKVSGTTVLLTDVFGAPCAACAVTAALSVDESQTQAFTGITGQYSAASVIATEEVGGIVEEVQTLSTQALADDIGGIFSVNFRNSLAQSPVAVINCDDTALDVQVKLQNLPTVGRLNVTRSDNAAFGVTWTITFLSNVGDLPLFLVDSALLTGTGATVVVKEVVKGVEVPFEAVVDGLSPQQPYYVRAYARNMNGYGAGTDVIQRDGRGALPLYASVGSAPDAPAITGLWPVSGSELEIKFSDPASHGAAVQRFIIEYAAGTSFGTPAVKRLYIFNSLANDIAGTFRLQYGDETSPLLSVHASARTVADELRSLSNLRPVTVTRATYVLSGETLSRVQSFVVTTNMLTTTQFTTLQSRMLVAGSAIRVGTSFVFTVKTQPSPGSTTLEVQAGHGVVVGFTGQSFALLKVDKTGSELGPHGYEWLITFAGDVEAVAHQVYPGLQLLSSLTSVETGTSLTTVGLNEKQAAIPPAHYGSFEVSNDATCDTYVVGAPSPVQVLQLFAPTTVTQGSFQLKLGGEQTACITLGAFGVKSSMKAELEALASVSRVTIEEQRLFKVSVLTGSAASKVIAVNAALTTLTLVSSKPGLTATEAAVLRKDALIMVSRNPNDFSRHACEFKVAVNALEDDTTLSVTVVGGTACTSFSGESRSLKVLDFHDYKIRFWGSYPTGVWPTLKVVPTAFGVAGTCTAWAPSVAVHSKIHTARYEGVCGRGNGGSQTILGDAASEIGGWFSLSYLGVETPSLAFKTTTASDLRAAIDLITAVGTVSVTVSQYGLYGKAWRVTFLQQHAETDTLFVKQAYLTGQNAYVSVYPTVEVFTEAKQNDISGTFRLAFGGIATERIAYAATHMKVTQELQKLVTVDSVLALGDTASGDIGVYSLALTATATVGSPVLGNAQLDSKAINPTLFLAIRESLMIGTTKYWIQAITPVDITLTDSYVGAVGVVAGTTVSVNVMVGLITRGTNALPGYVGISRLMRVITATRGQKAVELPVGHGYTQGNVLFIAGQKLTVNTVANGVVTTVEDYSGASVVAAIPELYVFDNKLRTTEDLRHLVATGDDLWLRSSASDMIKYTVTQVDKRYVLVDGTFVDSVIKRKVYHVTNGRKWSLVFRSYSGDLETFDAVPANDWRGTEARIGARGVRTVQARTVRAGNPAVTQTVLLEANSIADIGAAAEYTLAFGDETTTPRLPWASSSVAIKAALEALDGVDGVTVRSTMYENGFVHTVTFWGMYPTTTLPVLVGTVFNAAGAPGSVGIRVQSNNAVARSKQEAIVLESDQTYQLRVFAVNAKGISDSKAAITTRSALASVVPTPPTSVALGEYHGETWLSVNYRPPFYTGGAAITMYRLEWDSSPTFDSSSADYGVANIQKRFEVQQVTTVYRSDANIGGTFTLSWGGRTSAALAVDCTGAQMADALAVVTDTVNVAVDPVKVTRVAASWGYTWTITFLHTPGDLALLVADGSLVAGDFPRVLVTEVVKGFSDLAIGDFTHEVQDVFSDANSLLGGSFKLEFEGKLSRSISVDSSALEMQAALQDTTLIYSIKVTKTWRNQQLNTAVWSVTFAYLRGEELVGAGNIFTIAVADATTLTGTSAAVQVANKVAGSDPFTFTITGLRTGVKYYFHAMAYNAGGFGSANSPMSSSVTCGHPEPPKSVVATVVDGKTLAVTWAQNEKNGGCPIDKYRVEWYRAEGVREEQTITTSAGKGLPEVQRIVTFADSQSLGGYFKMRFLGETTENVLWNAPAIGLNSVKERLERLSTVGTVDATREQSIRVVDGLLMTASGNTLTRHGSSTTTLKSAGFVVGDSVWIAGSKWSITAVDIPTTLTTAGPDTLATAGPVPVFKTAYGYQWRVTFLSGHVGPQELIEAVPSDSWAGNNPGINVESTQKGLQPISGTFRLSFASRGISQTTLPLAHDVSASDMKVALENLVTVGLVAVSRSRNGFGYNWVVTFLTDVKSEISLLGVDGTELHGPSVRIMAALTTIGTQPTMYCEKDGAVGLPAEIQVPGSLRYVINGLLTGQRYAVRVRAHNEHGYGGDASISPSFQIPRTTPSGPKDVQLLVLSNRMLKVRWNAPLSDGGALITSYKIQWDTANGFASVGSPNYDMFGELRVQPTDSSPFYFNFPASNLRSYYVRVIAVNDQGNGIPEVSDPLSASPLSRTPGQPENSKATVLSSYAILVEWDPPSPLKPYYGGDGGLPITQYMVEWDSSDTFDSPAAFGLVSGTGRSYIIGGNDPVTGVHSSVLTSGTMYYIRVTSFNAKGAGTPRLTVPPSVIAANQVPTSPRDLQLTVIPATSIRASWTNPLYDGGASLKSYQVEWDEQEDFSSGQSSKVTVPIVREMQSIAVSTTVVNEEQFVDATVEVTNEQQVVRTVFTGADEIQIIETKNNPVVNEVQSITTAATDRDEVQELRFDGDDINEIQAIRTSVGDIQEVQTIQVVANRIAEVQTITMAISGAAADLSNIGGDISLSFDTSNGCTHCTLTRDFRSTGNVILSLQKLDDGDGAGVILSALNGLPNIGPNGVTVTRTSATVNSVLTFVYSIAFVGNTVAGNVPELRVVSSVTVNTNTLVTTIPNIATEASVGNEVANDPLSVFTVKFTCESYSDPLMIKSYSTACTPPLTDRLCPTCVTAFDGATFSLSADVSGTVAKKDRLVAGVCVFEVKAITTATISVDPTDVGALCSSFSGQALDLFKARKYSIDVPVKSAVNKLTTGSEAEGQLKLIIDTVSVTQTQFIDTTANLVGSVYTVTFQRRSGMIPLLECSAANIKVTKLGGGALCTVQRTTIGSMISGSFVLGLARQSDGTVVNTAAIPWDASEARMKSTLEAVISNNVKVFGTVSVKRDVFLPTANKWSGGFTWTIEFLDRGWNIPTMAVITNSLVNSDAQKYQPALTIEDALNPLPLFPAKSRDGNQVGGTITFAFGTKTSIPCIVGTHTSLATLDRVVVDTTLATFLVAQLKPAIPSIQVTRSAATQARGFTWTITFSDTANGGDVPPLDLPLTGLTGANARAKMYETVKGNQLGGTFQLKFNGETTGPILFSADKLSVQAQLNSLSSIKPSSVEVDRLGPDIDLTLGSQVLAYTWLITFTSSVWADPSSDHSSGIPGNWKGARAKWDDVWPETGYSKAWGRQVGPLWGKNLRLSCIKDGLTTTANDNSQSCVAAVTTAGIGPIKGTFKVALDSTAAAFMSVKKLVTSAPIAHNALATKADSGATGTSVEEILKSMDNVGDVAVTRSQANKLTGGYTWTVTFLRDKNGPCEQEEESAVVGVRLCNSPGDVPAMVADGTGLSGATPTATVCEKTAGNCYSTLVQNGLILRGDFTTFLVTNDPGFSVRYSLAILCPGGLPPPCNLLRFFKIPVGSEMIGTHLQQGDRFTIGVYTACVYTVVAVAAGKVEVVPLTCPAMVAGMANTDMPVSIRVPWNADEGLVKRVLEASSDQGNEVLGSVWSGGRRVSVKRTIHGKYGEVSWQIRFVSNPTFTPPGAGNLPDIATVFAPNPVSTFQVTVTQVTPGSVGLSGSFLVDFHSTIGPRQIRFDEDEERFQRKLNEMNTIGRVIVKKIKLPSTATDCKDSSCSGGWDDQPVDVPGTRGGYRWRIRFMKVTGEFGGLTFPSGSGNVGPLSVTLSTLQGNQKSIDMTTNLPGSSPILGGFVLNVTSKATPLLPYSSTADSIKQGIESMYLFGDVDVTRDYLVSQQVPGAIATLSKDGLKATIDGVDDIRQFLAPGDIVRFGASSSANLVGTNGDNPYTSVLATSKVTVSALSPIVRAVDPAATKLLFPKMQLRIDGLVYDVQHSGREVQTVAVTLLAGSWNDAESRSYFQLTLTRGGVSQTTACLDFNAASTAVETELNAKLLVLDANAKAGDIKVTRIGPVATDAGARRGYVYSVYFLGDTVAGDVSTLSAIDTACTIPTITDAQVAVKTVTHGGAIGQQRLSLATNAGQVIDTQGYFTLTNANGISTPCMTWGVSAAELEAKLETVLLTGDVLVSRRGSGNSMTEVQRLRLTSNSEVTTTTTGLFQLLFTIDGKTAATTCLAYGVSAAELQLAINAMSNLAAAVDHVNVTRDGDGSPAWGYGYEYLIDFRGPVAGSYSRVLGDVEQLQIINIGKSPCAPVVGGNPALILETVRQGAAAYTYDIFFLDSPAAVVPDLLLKDENAGVCNVNVKWVHNGGSSRKAWLTTIAPGGSSEVQTLVVKDATAAIPAGAQYYLSFGGPTVTTACIAFNALESVVQAKLEALASIGLGGVRVSRDVHPIDAPNGFIYKITFIGQLVTGNVPSIVVIVNDGTCTNVPVTTSVSVATEKPGGQVSRDFVVKRLYDGEQPGSHVAYSVSQLFSVMSEQFDVQKVTVLNPGKDLTTETYKLSLGGGAFTADIKWNADEAEMEAAFTAIPDGDVVVTRRTDTVAAPNGFVYTIYFSGVSVQGNRAEMTAVKPQAFGTADVKVSTVSNGVDGVSPFKAKSIPLALVKDSTVASPYLASDATLSVYKVNGFFWTIKFKSTVGNIPALGMQTSALTGKLALVDDFVAGAASNSYVLTNLFSGINYYVRVAAGTDIGLGPFTALASAIPSGVATPVQNIALGYALHSREVQEVRLAATHVTEIQEITTSAATMAEVQTLRTYASSDVCFDSNCIAGGLAFRVPTIQTIEVSALAPITAGSFSIGFVLKVSNGAGAFQPAGAAVTTAKIAWCAAASAVQTALEALDGIDPGDIVVTRDGDASSAFNYGYLFSVTFVGNNVAGQTPTFTLQTLPACATCDAFVVTGGMAYTLRVSVNPTLAMGTDTAVQQVVVKADKALAAGSYKLKFVNLGASQSSACIVFDAPARGSDVRAMENILMQMPNIDKVYVTRKLDTVAAPNGFVYRIFFYGNGVYGDVAQLNFEICTPFQTQENNVLTETGVNRQIVITMVDRGGFHADNTFVNAKTATADQLTLDLDRLPVFGDVIVSRSLADEQGGFIWTVAFKDSQGNLPQFICAVDAMFKAKPGAKCESSTLTDGNVLSGTFVVDSSVPINFDANAAVVKAALEAMAWVGAVQVVQFAPTTQLGYTWAVTFVDYVGDVPPLTVTSSLVGTSASIQVREVRKGNIIAGTFTLSYKGVVTSPIRWNAQGSTVSSNADGSSLQEKLEALDNVGQVAVERSTMDREGGLTWHITFLDNTLNGGDVPLLQANTLLLSGVGVVVSVREVRKGSDAVGDQLWLSFDPPQSDNGGPITKYQVRWDTSATFVASPGEYFIADPEVLYRTQRIVTGTPSLAWSSIKTPRVLEVQSVTVVNAAANGDVFRLTFRGATIAVDLVVGTSTAADLAAALAALSTVGTVVVTPATTTLNRGEVVQVTFTSELGDLPLLTSNAKVVIAETQKGVTNFRKEVVVFSCVGGAGKTVTFTYSGTPVGVSAVATLASLEASLHTLFNVEADSITVLSTQALMCAAAAPAADVTIVFDRVYGDISLAITSADAAVALNTDASVDGVYRDVPTAKMSGTFQVGYKGKYTRSLNAESSADDVRYALEDLESVTTAAVSKDFASQAIPGKLDVVKGQIFATCSAGDTCDFRNAGYGLPGYKIRIGGRWYTVRTDSVSDALDSTRLYLGDLNGRETGYVGESQTGVIASEWTKGYEWTVSMLQVDAPLSYLRAKIPRLYPSDSTVVVRGSSCHKCYYIPKQTTKKLTIGQEYFVEVVAFNDNGRGLSPVGGSVCGTPSQVPNVPSNVDLAIVSGKEIEVFFSPPILSLTNVSPTLNTDISSYIVQWDVRTDFKHGLPLCTACAVSLKGNVLTVTSSLTTLLKVDSTFTIADENCVLKVTAVASTQVDVANGHVCSNFDTRAYPLYYYVYAPAVLSGTLIQGSPPFRYLISNLDIATKYYVRVAAVNSVPVQQIALNGDPPNNRKWSFPLSATTKDTVPDPPVSVYLYPYSGTTLEVQIQPPTRDGKGQGGAQISHYWVDFDTVSTFDSAAKAAPVDVDVLSGDIPTLYAGGPRIYYLKNLNTGVRYFVQVKSRNSIGYSRATLAPNPLAPTRTPDGPVNVKVSTLTTSQSPIDSATVTWQKSVLDGGLPLTSYKVEWWGMDAQAEVQVIEVKWITQPTTALFTLAFGGGKTSDMPLDVSPENLRNALMNIVLGVQQVRHVLVSRTAVNVVQGYQWRVTFVSAANAGDLPMIQLDITPLIGSTDTVGRVFEAVTGARAPPVGFPGYREVQVLMTYHANTRVQGYFRLSYKGSAWSNYLPAEISAANLKLMLESLSTVGKVTVNQEGPSTNGFIWTITFDSNVGNAPALIVDSSKITPSDAFVGIKDGDNSVTKLGVLCVPGEDVCPGSWPLFTTGIAARAAPGEMVADYRFYETLDASTLTYKITGLVPGKLYYVSVTAKNALGLGTRIKATPMSITPPVQVPGSPTAVSAGVKFGIATQMTVTWSDPVSHGGDAVRMYRVEYDPSPLFKNRGQQDFWCPSAPTRAVWTVRTWRNGATGDPINAGSFTLQLTRNNQLLTTAPIPYDAVATAEEELGSSNVALSKIFCTDCPLCADRCLPSRQATSGSLQSKLTYLSSITGVRVVRTAAAIADGGGYTWTITFMDVGDDFVLAPVAPNGLACVIGNPNTCTPGDYRVTATKLTAGLANSPCTGTQTLPSVGALNKGQLYYVRVFAYNKVGFGLPMLAPSPQKPMVVPGPPTGVTLQAMSVSDLKVIFSPPDDDGGDTITAYQVEWSTDPAFPSPQIGVVALLAGGAPYYRVISSLAKGSFYFVRVKAANSQGYGQYQISSPASLNPYTTPSAPTKVALGVTSSTMLTVQWDKPDDDGGDTITAYVVQWDISASFDSIGADATKVKITDTSQQSYTIALLTPDTVYFVRVLAMNAGGLGTPQVSTPPSQIPVNTRPGKPHTLQVLAALPAGSLQVTWQVPRIPAHLIPCSGTQLVPLSCPIFVTLDVVFGGSSFESYLVQWSDNSDFTGFNWVSVTTNSALLTGLATGKIYFVRVLTVNTEGQKSDFCARANSGGYLCPDNFVLLDGTVVTGSFVSAAPV